MATACRNIALNNEMRYYLHVQDVKRGDISDGSIKAKGGFEKEVIL